MKKCITFLMLSLPFMAMTQTAVSKKVPSFKSQITSNKVNSSTEEEALKFAKAYIEHINRKNWIDGIEKYLPTDNEAFLKEHTAFRKSFPNYKATIKRIFVEGKEVVLWLHITANYAENYRYKNSNYGDQLLWDYDAKNQALDWDETWYFNVVDGKFGDKWDSIKDNYKIQKDLMVK